ncbi:GrpB family protein [Haladaptatus sp. GCM10025707]|uniref:GrpB family protein n=1 Tax=unclassified Haladaptatus TaxID=2622732 RepID=UPI0023E8C473|nr:MULTISPECIES: GrpB family protein [unclassified Haladaptatus]
MTLGLQSGTVELCEHDPAWHEAFSITARELRSLIGDRIERIEHVGSTAIPGIPAKPILDVLVVVSDVARAEELIPKLQSLGYEYDADDPLEKRLFFTRGPDSGRTHHLAVVEEGTERFEDYVAFRDALLANPELAEAYAALKRELAEQYADDRETYTNEKAEFVQSVLDSQTG